MIEVRDLTFSYGNIVALDTPRNLKEQNSSHSMRSLKSGIPFPYDELLGIHSQEPTLEDIFIQYAGRRLS